MKMTSLTAGKRVLLSVLLICSAGSLSLRAQITGGMVDPAMDVPGEPFSYFCHPTDIIGVLYAPVASEVTPEGYVYTGFGELMFFVGNPPAPTNVRIKTLLQGHLPVVQYQYRHDGVRYAFSTFAADLGHGSGGLPLNFVQVRLDNETKQARTAFLSSGYRFMPPIGRLSNSGDYRFRQRFELIPTQYTEGQTTFNPGWKYNLKDDALVRDGRILYLFPKDPHPWKVSLAVTDDGYRMYRYLSGEVEGQANPKYHLDPHTPMGVVTYRVSLKPGQSQSLVFKMPLAPIPETSAEAGQARDAHYSEQLDATVSFWEKLVGKSSPLRFPERKVQDYLLADTIFDLLAVDHVGDDYIPNVNKFQYHEYYGGDNTTNMAMAWEYMGLNDVAKNTLLHASKVRDSEGGFKMPYLPKAYPYWELFGYILWGWERHYQLADDRAFLERVYPDVVQAVAWEEHMTQTDPLGLMPKTTVADDAFLKDCHQTGQDMWVLIGLRNAAAMASAMGKSDDEKRFQADYQSLRQAFDKQLALQTSQSGGYIPPSLDRTLKGNNWDNLLTLYPDPLFDPFDPRVTATIRTTRATYHEGILAYTFPHMLANTDEGDTFMAEPQMHYWRTPDNAQNELVRDDPQDQELAVKDLYALLVHTSSTHAPQEFGTVPWSTRDWEMVSNDILPDGASSGKTIELLRNMLVREYKKDLYLFSAVSPAWLQAGRETEAVDEPTEFGPVSAALTATTEGFEMKISNRFRQAPEHIVIPIPWFYEATSAEADGQTIEISNGKLVLSPAAHHVAVKARRKTGAPELSFDRAVEDYKREYARRYQEFLQTGVVHPDDNWKGGVQPPR